MATIKRYQTAAVNDGRSVTANQTEPPAAREDSHQARRLGVGVEGRDLQGRRRLCVTGPRPGDGRRLSVGWWPGRSRHSRRPTTAPSPTPTASTSNPSGPRPGEQGGQSGREGVGRGHDSRRVECDSGQPGGQHPGRHPRDAIEHRALAFNPARRFKRGEKPKKSPKRHVYLTEVDVCRWPKIRPLRRPGADPGVHRVAVG